MTLHVLPTLAGYDIRNGGHAQAVPARESRQRYIAARGGRADRTHVVLTQLRTGMLLSADGLLGFGVPTVPLPSWRPLRLRHRTVSAPAGVAPLGMSVGRIAGVRGEEQVIGPDAQRRVARMADAQTVRDQAIVEFPRRAVRADVRSGSVVSDASPEFAVAGTRRGACPQPARPQFGPVRGDGAFRIDLRPEPLPERDRRSSRLRTVSTCAPTEPTTASAYLGGERQERGAAAFADAGDGRLTAHLVSLGRGVKPPDVASIAGARCCLNYTRYQIAASAVMRVAMRLRTGNR